MESFFCMGQIMSYLHLNGWHQTNVLILGGVRGWQKCYVWNMKRLISLYMIFNVNSMYFGGYTLATLKQRPTYPLVYTVTLVLLKDNHNCLFLLRTWTTITSVSRLIRSMMLSGLISHPASPDFMIQTMIVSVNKGWPTRSRGLQVSGCRRNKWCSLDEPLSKPQWGQYRVKARAKERAKNYEGFA